MSDYRNKTGKVFSEEQLRKNAADGNLNFEEYLIIGGFELIDEEGKQMGAAATDATTRSHGGPAAGAAAAG